MTASPFRSLRFLRPEDEGLTADAQDQIQAYRLLCLCAALLIPVFGLCYAAVAPDAVDPFEVRLGFSGLYGGLVAGSYAVPRLRRQFVPVVQGTLYLVLVWFVCIVALNDFDANYTIGLAVVYTVLSVPFGVGITTLAPLLWFLGSGTLLIGTAVVVVPHPETSPLILIACLLLLDLLLCIVVRTQLSMQRTLRRAVEKARAASQLKSALLSNMSHEVRTPLTAILGFAELIAKAEADDPEVLAERIHKSGERLLDMLNAVLQVARLESGAETLAPQRLDAADTVRDSVAALDAAADARGVQVHVDVPEAAPVQLAPKALRRIVQVLMRNAIEFSDAGDRVDVALRLRDDRLELHVKDTGIGMTDAFLEELFEAFRQESVGRGRTHEGPGLGLTVAHRLTERMGGSIDVDSEKGVGTRVRVRLPTQIDPAPRS